MEDIPEIVWRACYTWLTQNKVIPKEGLVDRPISNVTELAIYLRDGVLLCKLVNKLNSDALKLTDFNRKPQMIRVCLRALSYYLYFILI